MVYILDNLVAILAATGVSLTLGLVAVFVSRSLLPNAKALVTVVLAEFWIASILAGALILAPAQAPAVVMALMTPFIIWVGFIVPVIAVSGAVSDISARSTVLTALHWLIVMLAMGATLQVIGLTAPSAT